MSYIRGSIQFPPFTLIFIAADFISSVALIAISVYLVGTECGAATVCPYIYECHEIFLFCIQRLLRSYPISGFNSSTNRLILITTVSRISWLSMPLLFQKGQGVNITITDKQNNKLVDIINFIGIGIYEDHPEDFFWMQRISNKNIYKDIYKDILNILLEYDKDPSWMEDKGK